MKALEKLQSAIFFQAAEHEPAKKLMSTKARDHVVATAIVMGAALLAGVTGDAKAQQSPVNPSSCQYAGAAVGGILGAAVGKNSTSRSVGAVLGALGGGAAGYYGCGGGQQQQQQNAQQNNGQPFIPQQFQQHYQNQQPTYGSPQQRTYPVENVDGQPPRQVQGYQQVGYQQQARAAGLPLNAAPLSSLETEKLEMLSQQALDAKVAWKRSLVRIQESQGGQLNVANARPDLAAAESEARADFISSRTQFATVVTRMAQGTQQMPPKAVGRYLETSAALMELPVRGVVTYQVLEMADRQQELRSPTYSIEVARAASNRRGY